MRFTRARLTTFDDPQYRAYVARQTIGRDNQRAIRPPRERDLFGGEAEALLREWLIGQGLALSDRRILEYEERRGNRSNRKYRELDALVEAERRMHVFEIKASRTAQSLRRGYGQLSEVRDTLRLIVPNVCSTVLFVDTGIPTEAEIAELMRQDDAPPYPPQTLEQVLGQVAGLRLVASLDEARAVVDQIGVLRFSLDEIIALAGDRPLHLNWAADEDDEPPPPPPPPTRQTIAGDDDDDDDDSPFAAAFRRAQKE
ncbi:MAG TPA: hypothetical protein VGE07_22435 [Herpetosiphonaceae bacterium]